ncbi:MULTISPECIES: zf-TFIIB domain-containing protein [unclassified Halomonas]|uniref:TFIIB-type zinc ribbon-containing protein n=1 Tax=unclassified Halomonas TaxID=2609666 RepID=UPI0020767A54|nr:MULTISPECIES: zf-TFIIB domain-containing protein [unclassified Halomonas]
MPANHFSADCPSCGSRLKRLPATRRDSVHVYCMDCGHDFGRYEALVERYQQTLSELESELNVPTAPRRDQTELRVRE